jgi:hypothetical protein
MATSPRVFVELVPRRRAFSSAFTVSWTSGMWKLSPKTDLSSASLPLPAMNFGWAAISCPP